MKKNIYFFFLFFATVVFSQTLVNVDDHIKIDQFGYLPAAQKIAVLSDPQVGYNAPDPYTPGTELQVIDEDTGEPVFTASPVAWNSGQIHDQSGDIVWWFDFSAVTATGNYHIFDPTNDIKSFSFRIADDVYNDVLRQAVHMFYLQRCGVAKTIDADFSDSPCHIGAQQDTECHSAIDPTNESLVKDLSGGWHDAGDYNKYVNFIYPAVNELLSAYEQKPDIWTDDFNIPESGNGIPDLLDEIKWELDWLIKMQLEDGSCLMKVSVDNWQSSSPPSSDATPRYYGTPEASATISIAGIFAHAYLIYSSTDIPAMQTYAGVLLQKAEKAWQWLEANPGYSHYDNAGFTSSNPEISEYEQLGQKISAAVYLFAATGDATYREFFDNNYTSMNFYQWFYWYPYETAYQDAFLYYCSLPGATESVVTDIINNATVSMTQQEDHFILNWNNEVDAYRAYLFDNDYNWGSNSIKARTGLMCQEMKYYNYDATNNDLYEDISAGYLHFLHGVNPISKVMLTNMYDFGAEVPCDEMYHAWFGDGTVYDNARTSPIGPPPGYVTGGFNYQFELPDEYPDPPMSPPQNQPPQKSYRDWNTDWPEGSWEITEPSISYQAPYVKLLSKFINVSTTKLKELHAQSADIEVYPNPADDRVFFKFPVNTGKVYTLTVFNTLGEQVFRKDHIATSIVQVNGSKLLSGTYLYQVTASNKFVQSGKVVLK